MSVLSVLRNRCTWGLFFVLNLVLRLGRCFRLNVRLWFSLNLDFEVCLTFCFEFWFRWYY